MQTTPDYRKFAILYVDDEEKSLTMFARAFGDQFRILTAPNATAALRTLEQHRDEIGLLMTDQRMPGENGTWLLEKARQLEPRMVRILVTAYSDMDAAIAAVNAGAIYKYVSKPWDVPQLEITLKHGLDYFAVQRERDELLREKLSVLQNMMIADRIVSLGLLAAGMSHHIRNSLVAVKTFLDLAPAKLADEKQHADRLHDPDFWKEYHQNVQSQIEKINLLLRELWAASETPTLDFNDRVRLADVVTAAREKFQAAFAAKRLSLTLDIPEALPELRVDRARFHRLFELLFKDELASLPQGSCITVAARLRNGDAPEKAQIEICVSDNGPGLPAEALRLMFHPFVLRADSPAEFGINLMACYFIVHHHGGTIRAASNPAHGTTFTLRLPLDPARAAPAPDEAAFLQKAALNDELWQKLAAAT